MAKRGSVTTKIRTQDRQINACAYQREFCDMLNVVVAQNAAR